MIKLNFKNFGLLEILIIASFLYVVGMLIGQQVQDLLLKQEQT